jgi:hypothetical protein
MQESACESDHFEVLKFLHISWNYNTVRTIERAAYLGRVDIFEWYYERNFPFFEKIATGRMVNNHLSSEDGKPIDILKDALLG